MSLQEKRCMNCMKPMGIAKVCPFCGYDEDTAPMENALKPGTRLQDRYTVGTVLRKNGEGISYIAYDEEIGARVEIREYIPELLCARAEDSDRIVVRSGKETHFKTLMSDFVDLAKSVSKFRTLAHIKQIYELFEQNGTVYYVGEYVEGNITLSDYLRSSETVSWKIVARLMAPLINTIGILNASNIIHRGISPETIYVTKKGELKLGDFCISAVRAANTELTGEIVDGYAAPEQYSVNSWYGAWTDVYAISAIIYRMLTGVKPMDARSRAVNDELTHPRNINPQISAAIAEGILSGMKLSPDNRIQSMQELSVALLRMGETDAQVLAAKTKAAEEEQRRAQKKKLYMIIGAVAGGLLVVLAVIFIILFTLSPNETDAASSLPDFSIPTKTSSVERDEVSSQPRDASYSMPDLVGLEYSKVIISDDYTSLLTIEYKEGYSDKYAKGLIMEQSIEVETPIAVGEKVTVTVSMGKEHEIVPDYEGYTFDEYRAYLDSLGIANKVRLKDADGEAEGEIVTVNPPVGSKLNLAKGDSVLIYLDNTKLVSSDATSATESAETEE